MKTAIVMFADSPSFLQLAGELNLFLQSNSIDRTQAELWLFYQQKKPAISADLGIDPSQIQLIRSNSGYLPEALLAQLVWLQQQKNAELLLFSGDALGNELATRLAFRLKGSACLNAEKMALDGRLPTVSRSAYGNNLTATFKLLTAPYCLAIARTAARPAATTTLNAAQSALTTPNDAKPDWLDAVTVSREPAAAQPHATDKVLVIGRGVAPNLIATLQATAQALGAYLAGSRPVVMDGRLTADRMIGVSGLKLAPNVCIVAGASGAAAFTAGIGDSEFIVAVNNDKNARIFTLADVAIVDDLGPIFTELNALMASE